MNYEIKHRHSGEIIFSSEGESLKDVVAQAIKSNVSLINANLSHANLSDADLSHANLSGTDLRYADLSDADLSGTDLSHANLRYANLSGAYLSQNHLRIYKHDLWGVLLQYPSEIPDLVKAIKEGKIDGSVYSGECACLMGTIANIKHCDVDYMPKDADSPAEQWFTMINPGDTPENNFAAQKVIQWIEEFLIINKNEVKHND